MFKKPKKKQPKKKAGGEPNPGGVMSTTQKMKNTIDKLQKRRDFLDKKSGMLKRDAVAQGKAGNRKAALLKLKHKKLFDQEVLKIDSSIFAMERHVLSLEQMATNQDIYGAMKQGVKEQQRLNRQVNVDDVANIQDEIIQQTEDIDEVGNILAEDMMGVEDDDELLDELRALEFDDINAETETETVQTPQVVEEDFSQLPTVPTGTQINLPKVPAGEVVIDDDAEALRELEAALAL